MTALAAVPDTSPDHDPKRAAVLTKAIEGMDPDFLACRDVSHSWKNFGARWFPTFRYYEQVLKCLRCGTQRFRRLNSRGHVLESWYEYPPGYLMPAGTGRLTTDDRDSIRLASVLQGSLREVGGGD